MMDTDSLRIVAPSGVSSCWLSPCRRACSAGAFAPRFAQPPAQPSSVQTSCLECERPEAVTAFVGGLAASSAAPPGHRYLERMREEKAEGKTKGGGTWVPTEPVCTWDRSGTVQLRRRAASGVQRAPMRACPRALHARTCHSLLGLCHE